jgi:hypothetical protein
MPSWLTSSMELAGFVGVLPWLLIPVALLIVGLIQLRRSAPGRRWYQVGWAAAAAVGAALEALIPPLSDVPGPAYQGPPVWAWGLVADAAAFLATGIVMITILIRAT